MKVSIGNILKNMRDINTNLTQKDIGEKLSIADNTIISKAQKHIYLTLLLLEHC